jgi:amino acid transporter
VKETVWVIVRCLPSFTLTALGVYSVLEVFFPALREPNFNRWQIEDDSASSIQILGWRKVLRPPRVIAQGYMSEAAACTVAISIGALFIIVGFFGIRHASGVPALIPDILQQLSSSD